MAVGDLKKWVWGVGLKILKFLIAENNKLKGYGRNNDTKLLA